MRNVFRAKLRRIREGNAPRVLDLFSGCGGISLGFHAAGCAIAGAIELDEHAILSHAMNFHGEDSESLEVHSVPRDITQHEPADVLADLRIRGKFDRLIDIIVGGPPCQAYARVGRAKLREVDAHPEAFLRDARGNLYLRYLQYVRELKPLALLMENVPDVMNVGGHNVAQEVCEVLSDLGYECRYTLLNAAYYGVPQMRERMYLLAYRKELAAAVRFPAATRWIDLPVGYRGSRHVALRGTLRSQRSKDGTLFDEEELGECYYVEPPLASRDLPPAVSTADAICDLPPLTAHLTGGDRRGARHFRELTEYEIAPVNDFVHLMRNWPGFENPVGIYDHVIRSLPRDYPIFKAMKAGDQYPEAKRIAENRLLPRAIAKEEQRLGRRLRDPEMEELKKKVVPPYDAGKFPNKWRKLEPDLPSRTLMAHIGKDTYSHIHYDGRQARTISVREAARLQSFPDGFRFSGTMNPAFRQIGNAVPPLMARAIALEIVATLKGSRRGSRKRVWASHS